MKDNDLMEKIVSLAKRRGFVYPSSEIHGGLSGMYDLGPLGAELAHHIKDLWWRYFVSSHSDMYGLSSRIMMPERVWKASGHLKDFSDLLVACEKCRKRFRLDQLDNGKTCPECGGTLSETQQFNLMFPVEVGAGDEGARAYLRGELAQGMFVNFKNIVDSFHPKLPFGVAQIGRAFRNEIAPRDFLFRIREFEIMEFEYFVREDEWEKYFEYWREEMWKWIDVIGVNRTRVHELEVLENDRAHYSKRTIDFEYDYPFGRKELYGLAYRGDFDLRRHSEYGKESLEYHDEESGESFIPHVIEPTFGLERTILAVLLDAYAEDELGSASDESSADKGEKRVFLKLKPALAPIKVAVFPLLRNKPALVAKAREVYESVKKEIPQTMWDDNGNIGKRYRRQDEIGTVTTVTVDFQTLENDTVTLRDRDTAKQVRVEISRLNEIINRCLAGEEVLSFGEEVV